MLSLFRVSHMWWLGPSISLRHLHRADQEVTSTSSHLKTLVPLLLDHMLPDHVLLVARQTFCGTSLDMQRIQLGALSSNEASGCCSHAHVDACFYIAGWTSLFKMSVVTLLSVLPYGRASFAH